MTAKDKARELVEKFEPYVNYQKDDLINEIERMRINSKQCALITVDEIIKTISLDFIRCNNRMQTVTYWQEVKNEINKL